METLRTRFGDGSFIELSKEVVYADLEKGTQDDAER